MEQQINLTNQYSTCGIAKIPQVIKEIKQLLKEAELITNAAAKAKEEHRINVPEDAVISLIEDDVLNSGDLLDEKEEEEDILFQEPRVTRGQQKKKAAKTNSMKAVNTNITVALRTNPAGRAIKGGLLSADDSSEDDGDLGGDGDDESDDYCSETDVAVVKWKDILHGKGKTKRSRAKTTATKGERYSEDTEEEAESPIGHKVIVFAHHKAVMDALEASFLDVGVRYVRVDGDVSQSKRDVSIRAFQEDNCTHLALLSVTACGTGLNLTRANIAVFAELCWSHGAMLQAEDRIHR